MVSKTSCLALWAGRTSSPGRRSRVRSARLPTSKPYVGVPSPGREPPQHRVKFCSGFPAAGVGFAGEARLPRFRLNLIGAIILAFAVAVSGSAVGEAVPLAVTEIATGVFVHNGVQQDASPANDDEIA